MVINIYKNRRLKGQFFILGALLLCVLFYLGLPPTTTLIKAFSADLSYLSENMELELPHALNLGLNKSEPISALLNFTQFASRVMKGRMINFSCLWLVTQPYNNSGVMEVNVTVGNFLGYATTVTLNLSGEVGYLDVENNSTNSTTFSPVAIGFNLTIKFDDIESELSLVRDKVNLYSDIKLTRGEESVKKEISA